MPRVLNKRFAGIPAGAVFIGRPTKWGNPFTHLDSAVRGTTKVATRDLAIARYREHIAARPELVAAAKRELVGKDLVCFCRPVEGFQGRLLCHGQILVGLANNMDPEDVE